MTRLLQDYATQQAARQPDATALVAGEQRMTYGQFEEQSNRLANMLRKMGCRRGDRVCMFLSKSPAAVMAMHAIMKADCAYVPIDLSSPAPRIGRIVQSCRPKMLLVERSAWKLLDRVIPTLADPGSITVGSLDRESLAAESCCPQFSRADVEAMDATTPERENSAEDTAHILYTSGSTGIPKGVVISHANVLRFVDWAQGYFGIGSEDRVSSHPPLHFDLSTFDIYGTLSAGACLHMVPSMLNLLPPKLVQFIRDSELTQWFSVPSALTMMVKTGAVQSRDFPQLKRMLWCGEVLPTPTLMALMQRLPHVQFTNLYGPTESTIASSYFTVENCPTDPLEQIPIGTPCDGEQLMVLDQDLQPKADGETGDLYIAGGGLSPGYWEDPEKTEAAFVTRMDTDGVPRRIYKTGDLAYRDSDGLFYFLGRNDTQIKSRGYRIELGEIETAMNALGVLRDCAVVGIPTGGFEGTAICCAYVAEADQEVSPESLRTKASRMLPSYMLPARWMGLAELPKNGSGKTDRRELKELFGTATTT